MSGRRRRSESLWDRKEDTAPQTEMSEKIPRQGKELHSGLHGDTSPKRSNSEANDALISADFSGPPMQGNANMPTDNDNSRDRHRMNTDPAFDEWENQYSSRPSDDSYGLPYRAGGTGNMSRDRERSRSPNESRSRGRDRDRDRDRSRSRSRSRGRARSPFSGDRNSGDQPRNRGSGGYRKDHHRGNRNANDDQDHRRQSTQTSRVPCKFFSMGKCNRNSCKFSHDNIEIQGHNSGNNNTGPSWNDVDSETFDDKNTWNEPEKNAYVLSQHTDKPSNEGSQAQLANATIAVMPEVPANSYFQQHHDAHNMNQQIPSYGQDFIQQSSLNGSGQDMFLHVDLQNQTEIQAGKPLETWKNDIPQESSLPVSLPQIANALELLYALPISAASGGEFIKPSVPSSEQISTGDPNSKLRAIGVQDANEEPAGNLEGNENPGKSEAQQGKVEESNISNDEKAMRQFKIALVEFVKEILKPTWKEGKMSREVYKTIVKKVVDKVTSTIQGNQIPRTQEKIDQYLAFSKSKITKLVEAYVGRFLKA